MRFIVIDSVDDEQVAAYTNLTELQLRNRLEPAKGLFIAESPKVIDRALAAGREPISLLVEEPWIDGMADTFAHIDQRWGVDIPVYVASPAQLKRLTGYRLHRGALAAMRRWPLPTATEICRDAHRIAVMENIVDHTNVGALMRSAAALDVDAVWSRPPAATRCTDAPHGCRWALFSRFHGPASAAMTRIIGRCRAWPSCAVSASPRSPWRLRTIRSAWLS